MLSLSVLNTIFITYEPEGVMISVKDTGRARDPQLVMSVISHAKLQKIDINEVQLVTRGEKQTGCLAPAQEPANIDESAIIRIESGDMAAYAVFLPPLGEGAPVTAEKLEDMLASAGVRAGISKAAIEAAIADENRYSAPILLAEGKQAVDGEPGSVELLFKTERSKRPKIGDDGKVDYYTLDLFEEVTEGQEVAVRTPATSGENGFTVKGQPIIARPGREVPLPIGKNVMVGPDGNTVVATASGHVNFVGGRVVVSSTYVVEGDANLGVGNINYAGDVIIRGNVITGLSISAATTVEIAGTVEGAKIKAGSGIVLRKGIQGADKGMLTSGGDIVAVFIESCTVNAEGSIFADAIIRCTINCEGSLYVKGRKGALLGGNVRVSGDVFAKNIGSPANGAMSIEVGLSPTIRQDVKDAEKLILTKREEVRKLEMLVMTMNKRGMDDAVSLTTIARAEASRAELLSDISIAEESLEELHQRVRNAGRGKVHVAGHIYPGVTITIGSCMYTVREDMDFVTFKERDGEIHVVPCENANY